MARKRKKPSSIVLLLLGAMIVFGIAVVGMTVLEIPIAFSPLSLIDSNRNINCDGTECRIGLGFNQGRLDSSPFNPPIMENFPLSETDLNAPILVDFRVEPTGIIPVGCETQLSTNEMLDINAFSVQPGSTVPTLTTGILEGGFGQDTSGRRIVLQTDIQPLLTDGQDVMAISLQAGLCDIGGETVTYNVFNGRCSGPSATDPTVLCTRGASGVQIYFFKKPPELNSPSLIIEGTSASFGIGIQVPANVLLSQNDFLSQQEVEVFETSFAVGEKFQLTNPTVITDIQMTLFDSDSFGDSKAVVTGFVWNIDESPPKRIAQSQSITGIGPLESNFKFSFPNAVVLMPGDSTPTNYAVGIRVDQNTESMLFGRSPQQTANTHQGIIDLTPTANAESSFVDAGLIGIDIFHDRLLAETILALTDGGDVDQPLPDQPPEPLTQSELISILCAGLEPEPEICQGDTFQLTINQCGATEVFFDGDCLCAPNYDRNEAGSCEIREVPSLLKIGEFSSEELVVIGIGLLILITGAVGIIAFIRR